MKRSSTAVKPCALLWDESFLWGIMSFNALKAAGLSFDLIHSEDIRNGILRTYRMIFVPGGWASNKIKSLGDTGVREIRRFVEDGGNYLGFCGGAGLATLDGIGLLNIKRVPTKDRVPSFSGRTLFSIIKHCAWDDPSGVTEPIFHVWWPSQFSLVDSSTKVLATYKEALPDSFSSDLNVGDVRKLYGGWESLESDYGINLDPARLYGQPAMVEGNYGKGKVVLSLIHFDTPSDKNGSAALKNLWKYLANCEERECGSAGVRKEKTKTDSLADVSFKISADLIAFGERNFLWFWRNPMLLQWRRGIRGLEYCTLYGMLKTITDHSEHFSRNEAEMTDQMNEVLKLLWTFKKKAERLLFLERQNLHDGRRMTYEKSDNPEIIELRAELFSTSKSYGGMLKRLLDKIDAILYSILHKA